jgi:ribosomal protein L37AE/L43A
MPRYDVRNDGAGPYAVFYCDMCSREFRSQPDIAGTVTQEVTQQAARGLLRNIPVIGGLASSTVQRDDPRYSHTLTPQQLEKAWAQFQDTFHECPVCHQMVCPSDWDPQTSTCREDSPRKGEIAQAQAEQAAGALKGFASALGLGGMLQNVGQAVKSAGARAARCPKDGTLAAPGTKFCPQCGSPMVQPAVEACAKCGADVTGVAFCPQCGTKVERQAAAVTTCPNCGASVAGAKFCPSCGTKVG